MERKGEWGEGEREGGREDMGVVWKGGDLRLRGVGRVLKGG